MVESCPYIHDLDLDPDVASKSGSYGLLGVESDAWEAFSESMEMISQLLTVASELSLVLSLSRHTSAFTLAILAAATQLFIERCFSRHLIGTSEFAVRPFGSLFVDTSVAFVAFCNNRPLLRMAALHDISFENEFRQDRISNNYGNYIEKGVRLLYE